MNAPRFLLIFWLVLGLPELTNNDLESELKQFDESFSGNVGVYVKYMNSGQEYKYATDREWYLASTVKIPVGIAILQRVENGDISLDDTITLQESDFVDGSGDLMFQEPGTDYTVRELITRMIRESDSTATDMLIRFLGVESLNEQVKESIMPEGISAITTIMQVRYDAYGEITPEAEKLSNLDIVDINEVSPLSDRYLALLEKLKISEENVESKSIVDAFQQYYTRGINSGSLSAMGSMLEKLHNGDYLTDENTTFLLDIMKSVNTGDRRIKAGLPQGAQFAHKTGTQIGRSCNMGIVNPDTDNPVVVAACAESYVSLRKAEEAFQTVGELVSENL